MKTSEGELRLCLEIKSEALLSSQSTHWDLIWLNIIAYMRKWNVSDRRHNYHSLSCEVKPQTNEGIYIELIRPESLCWLGEQLHLFQFCRLQRFTHSREVCLRGKGREKGYRTKYLWAFVKSLQFSNKSRVEVSKKNCWRPRGRAMGSGTSWGVEVGRSRRVSSDFWKPKVGPKGQEKPIDCKGAEDQTRRCYPAMVWHRIQV